MKPFFIPILAVDGAAEMLQQGLTMSEDISAIYGRYWAEIFTSGLYSQIVNLALIFSVGCLVLFMMRFAYVAVHEGDHNEPIRSLVWPLIVVLLLSNNGAMTALMARNVRDVINTTSENILAVSFLDVSLEEAIRGSLAKGVIASEISAQIMQCQPLLGQAQIDCLEAAYAQVEGTVNDFRSQWVDTASAAAQGLVPGLTLTLTGIRGAIDAYKDGGGAGAVLPGFFGGIVGSTSRALVHAFLMAFQWGFVNLLQISLLLTGMMGPIAVAASLLPFGGKPIFAWLTGFLSLGFAQICYNLIVGLAAVVIMNANTFDTNGFLVLIAILAPALALGLATGGGLAIFNIMLAGSTGAATLLVTRMSSVSSYSLASYRR